MPSFRTLDNIDVSGKRVIVRLDLNVPMKEGKVTDVTRLERQAPTVRELVSRGAAVFILSHFDRPKGKVVPEMSLKPVAEAFAQVLKLPVQFAATDWHDSAAFDAARNAKPCDIIVFENTRFHAGEEKNDAALARIFSALGEVYVNDAFSAAHRAHASTEGVAKLLPSVAGRSMQAELEALEKALKHPMRPVMAIVGGAKVSTKLDLLGNLISKVDRLVIGGGMANTFLAAQNYAVGKSLCEHDLLETARTILREAKTRECEIVLPVDALAATAFAANAPHRIADITTIKPDEMILDIGPKTIELLTEKLSDTKTVVWNGPFGAFELKPFDTGTATVARTVAELTRAKKVVSIAGGGDTVAALNVAGVALDFSYVSTAGGAFLEWMEGKVLPGVEALMVK